MTKSWIKKIYLIQREEIKKGKKKLFSLERRTIDKQKKLITSIIVAYVSNSTFIQNSWPCNRLYVNSACRLWVLLAFLQRNSKHKCCQKLTINSQRTVKIGLDIVFISSFLEERNFKRKQPQKSDELSFRFSLLWDCANEFLFQINDY